MKAFNFGKLIWLSQFECKIRYRPLRRLNASFKFNKFYEKDGETYNLFANKRCLARLAGIIYSHRNSVSQMRMFEPLTKQRLIKEKIREGQNDMIIGDNR